MIKYILTLSIMVTCGWSQKAPINDGLAAGTLSDKEIFLTSVESQIQTLLIEKEKLEALLNKRLIQKDSLKASGASENTQTKYTAVSFQISQKLESLNHLLKELMTQRNQLRADLYLFFTQKIDSLAGLEKSKQTDGALFLLMGKRLQVSPLAGKLHFNPQQLGIIDETESDSLSQIIFVQYLQSAAKELGKEIEALENKEQEIEELAALELKAEEFMQEMEESSLLQSISSTPDKSKGNLGVDYTEYDESSRNLVMANEQAVGFIHLINQWQSNPSQISSGNQQLTYPQLLEKFEETRQLLQSYRQQVLNKLDHLSDR